MFEKEKEKKIYYLCIAMITGVIILSRLYQLGSVTEYLYCDEAGLMYNIKSLLNYGVDVSGNSWSIYPVNYGDGQSALYTYLTLMICRVLGVNPCTIRLTAVIFSMVTYIFGFQIVKEIYHNNRRIQILYAILFMTAPYFFLSGRIALDCNLMLGMSTIVLWSCIKIFQYNQTRYYFIFGMSTGLTLYSYALSHIAIPIFLILVLICAIKRKIITWKKFAVAFAPIFVMAIPLLVFHFINLLGFDSVVIGKITIPNIEKYRAGEFAEHRSFLLRIGKLLFCIFGQDARMMGGYFPFNNFYVFSVPFLIFGVAKMIKDVVKKTNDYAYIIVSFVVALIITLLSINDYELCTIYRMNAIFFCLLLFVIEGILWSIQYYLTNKKLIGISVVYICFFVLFISNYFTKGYKRIQEHYLYNPTYPNVIEYLKENNREQSTICFLSAFPQSYIYYLLTNDISPYEINWEQKYDLNGASVIFENKFEYQEGMIYIVRKEDGKIAEELKDKGYTIQLIDSCYVCINS